MIFPAARRDGKHDPGAPRNDALRSSATPPLHEYARDNQAAHASHSFARASMEGNCSFQQHAVTMSLPPTPRWPSDDAGVPKVDGQENFGDLVDKLSQQAHHPRHYLQPVDGSADTSSTRSGYRIPLTISAGASKAALCSRLLRISQARCTIPPSSRPCCTSTSHLPPVPMR
jgi:hypothetical protein